MQAIEDQNKLRTLRTNESQKINEKKIHRINYLERERLDDLKKKLTEKSFRDLSNKYSILIKEKKYNIVKFKKDFDIIMEKNYDFNNPDFKTFFRKVEKKFLNIMYHLEDKNILNDSEFLDKNYLKGKVSYKSNGFAKHQRNFINNKRGNSTLDVNKYHTEISKREEDYNEKKRLYSPLKDEYLRKNANDDWRKLIKNQNEKYLDEKEQMRNTNIKIKNEYKNSLFEQMKEKQVEKKWDEEEEKFYKEK